MTSSTNIKIPPDTDTTWGYCISIVHNFAVMVRNKQFAAVLFMLGVLTASVTGEECKLHCLHALTCMGFRWAERDNQTWIRARIAVAWELMAQSWVRLPLSQRRRRCVNRLARRELNDERIAPHFARDCSGAFLQIASWFHGDWCFEFYILSERTGRELINCGSPSPKSPNTNR